MREALAEDVPGVPSRADWGLRNFVADGKEHAGAHLGGFEIEGLLHVVLGCVVDGGHPRNGDFLAVEGWIDGFEAFGNGERGDTLLDEGILIAADKEVFFGHGVGADFEIHVTGDVIYLIVESGMVGAESDDILEFVEKGNAIHINVGGDLIARDGRMLRIVVRA
jgi:hypothetical protein